MPRPRPSGCASRAWPRPTTARTVRTPRAPWPCRSTGTSPRIAELKCETDFVAKSDQFTSLVQEIATLVAAQGRGRGAGEGRRHRRPEGRPQGEHRARPGRPGRGGRRQRRRHLRPPPGRPRRQRRDRRARRRHARAGPRGRRAHRLHQAAVPVAATRSPRPRSPRSAPRSLSISKAEGKPEAALDKIVEGRLTGWFKERVLLEQNYVKDEKQTISSLLGDATVVRFEQVAIGA